MRWTIFLFTILLNIPNFLISSTTENLNLLDEILSNDEFCVMEITDDKVYLYPENVLVSENGVIVKLSHEDYLVTPFLKMDNYGYYICGNIDVKKPCPYCGERIIGAFGHRRSPECMEKRREDIEKNQREQKQRNLEEREKYKQ